MQEMGGTITRQGKSSFEATLPDGTKVTAGKRAEEGFIHLNKGEADFHFERNFFSFDNKADLRISGAAPNDVMAVSTQGGKLMGNVTTCSM